MNGELWIGDKKIAPIAQWTMGEGKELLVLNVTMWCDDKDELKRMLAKEPCEFDIKLRGGELTITKLEKADESLGNSN